MHLHVKIGFDTAENEPAKKLSNFGKHCKIERREIQSPGGVGHKTTQTVNLITTLPGAAVDKLVMGGFNLVTHTPVLQDVVKGKLFTKLGFDDPVYNKIIDLPKLSEGTTSHEAITFLGGRFFEPRIQKIGDFSKEKIVWVNKTVKDWVNKTEILGKTGNLAKQAYRATLGKMEKVLVVVSKNLLSDFGALSGLGVLPAKEMFTAIRDKLETKGSAKEEGLGLQVDLTGFTMKASTDGKPILVFDDLKGIANFDHNSALDRAELEGNYTLMTDLGCSKFIELYKILRGKPPKEDSQDGAPPGKASFLATSEAFRDNRAWYLYEN